MRIRGKVAIYRIPKWYETRGGEKKEYVYERAVILIPREYLEVLKPLDGKEVWLEISVTENRVSVTEKSSVTEISVTEKDIIAQLRVPLSDKRIRKLLEDRLRDFVASGLDYEVYEEDDIFIVAYKRSDYGVLVVPQDSEKGFFIGKLLRRTQWVYDRDTDSMLVAMKNIGQRIRIWDSKKRKFVAEF